MRGLEAGYGGCEFYRPECRKNPGVPWEVKILNDPVYSNPESLKHKSKGAQTHTPAFSHKPYMGNALMAAEPNQITFLSKTIPQWRMLVYSVYWGIYSDFIMITTYIDHCFT